MKEVYVSSCEMIPQGSWTILPSEKAAERRRREQFALSSEKVRLGETVFSLPHFVRTLANPERPILSRATERHLIQYCLKKFPLKYYARLQRHPSLVLHFLNAIKQLKRFCITPEHLEDLLKESGSLKENDLWLTYQRYENLKKELGFYDEEDLYPLAAEADVSREKICFEDFFEKTPALEKLLKSLKAKWVEPKIPQPASLKNIELFSLPTPHQEGNWLLSQLHGHAIGILTCGDGRYYEELWQKMRHLNLAEGLPPFSSLKYRPQAQTLLRHAQEMEKSEAPLDQWLASLLSKISGKNDLEDWVAAQQFPESVVPLGVLSKQEWIDWLKNALDENPREKIPDALEGIQWISLGEGDFPPLKTLFVPRLVEGVFPQIAPPHFFENTLDRGRPEWETLCTAFPDVETAFEKKRKTFLYALSKAAACRLSFPRRDSFGGEQAPSPFTWDFGKADVLSLVSPPILASKTPDPFLEWLPQKMAIEKERFENRLQTGAFHAVIPGPPLKPDHIFSISQLESYAACPFKYYAQRILNIPQQKEYSPEVDYNDKGTLFHGALEQLLRDHAGLYAEAILSPKKEEALLSELEKCVESVFKQHAEEYGYANALLYSRLKDKTCEEAKAVLKKEFEDARRMKSPPLPKYVEWTFGASPQGALRLETDGAEILLGGKVDRIDLEPKEKRFLILDYKTGSGAGAGFQDKLFKGLSLQIPLYIFAVQKLLLEGFEPIGGLLIATKKGKRGAGLVNKEYNETNYILSKRSGALLDKSEMEEKIAATMEHIRDFVAKIRSGFFEPKPVDCSPRCDYKDICRYAHKPVE